MNKFPSSAARPNALAQNAHWRPVFILVLDFTVVRFAVLVTVLWPRTLPVLFVFLVVAVHRVRLRTARNQHISIFPFCINIIFFIQQFQRFSCPVFRSTYSGPFPINRSTGRTVLSSPSTTISFCTSEWLAEIHFMQVQARILVHVLTFLGNYIRIITPCIILYPVWYVDRDANCLMSNANSMPASSSTNRSLHLHLKCCTTQVITQVELS
ncbi:hypothetical protein BDV36DRAFT_114041 [Aspergillus pseudocaelatus]|uniref:Uncharacterized protein n=1 Tax=Aspergillus pseudocaelatus TaxID=1825620 RepID=A0ABQ6W0K3_9EURO|nr:hypothetical protein BDV36DRAFT_114041 [Aspergillus pseudocaelatus]